VNKSASETSTKGDIRNRVLDIIVRESMVDREKIKGASTLDELGVQSIDVVIILNAIEDEFKIYVPIDQTMNDLRTVDELVGAIVRLIEKPSSGQRPA
jgi:acyl carrier protein